MVRWEPNARGRLEQAALELYVERGFEQTTVAEIAKRAGLTERTFFRYFADKREVLFGGSGELQELLAQKVAEAPAALRPSTRLPGLEALVRSSRTPRRIPDQRQSVIRRKPRTAGTRTDQAGVARRRHGGSLTPARRPDPAASLTAEAGIAVFKIAFGRWVHDTKQDFADLLRDSLDELKAVTAGSEPTIKGARGAHLNAGRAGRPSGPGGCPGDHRRLGHRLNGWSRRARRWT